MEEGGALPPPPCFCFRFCFFFERLFDSPFRVGSVGMQILNLIKDFLDFSENRMGCLRGL